MDRSVMLERLEWLSKAPAGCETPDWLHEGDGTWASGIRAVTAAALDEIKDQERRFELRWNADMRAIKRWQAAAPAGEDRSLTWPDHADLVVWLLEQRAAGDWRPIAEAPVGEPREGFYFNCLIQTERGIVGEGCARYVRLRSRGTKAGELVLRWYLGYGGRDARVCTDPKYFMPLPAKRED